MRAFTPSRMPGYFCHVVSILGLVCFGISAVATTAPATTMTAAMTAPEATTSASKSSELPVNSDLEKWQDGKPLDWSIIVGATEGEGPKSVIKTGAGRLSDGQSLALSGDHSTQRWQAVFQSFDVTPGEIFRLSGWLRSENITRDGHRYSNSQAAVMAK
jgi:hypothetical protein